MDRLQWPRIHREGLLEALDVGLSDRNRLGEHVPLHHLGARRRRQRALVTEEMLGLRQQRRRVDRLIQRSFGPSTKRLRGLTAPSQNLRSGMKQRDG